MITELKFNSRKKTLFLMNNYSRQFLPRRQYLPPKLNVNLIFKSCVIPELKYSSYKNTPGQIVPLFGHLFKQHLHCSDTLMVFFRPLQIFLSLALELVGLVTELEPGMAQTVKLCMLWRLLGAC